MPSFNWVPVSTGCRCGKPSAWHKKPASDLQSRKQPQPRIDRPLGVSCGCTWRITDGTAETWKARMNNPVTAADQAERTNVLNEMLRSVSQGGMIHWERSMPIKIVP